MRTVCTESAMWSILKTDNRGVVAGGGNRHDSNEPKCRLGGQWKCPPTRL
jgi:hypothetical protein